MGSPAVLPNASSACTSLAAERTSGCDDLVTSHRYLCARGARKFLRPHLERSDLEQIAAVALVKAARRYDPDRSTPFEAYAWTYIVGELMHHVRDHEFAIRLPRGLVSLERDAARTRDAFLGRFEREPRPEEVARLLDVSAARVTCAIRARYLVRSAPLDGMPEVCRATSDTLSAEDRMLIDLAFASLDGTQRRIIAGVYYFGFTQAYLATRLELTPKCVSRIHLSALARMRRTFSSDGCASGSLASHDGPAR